MNTKELIRDIEDIEFKLRDNLDLDKKETFGIEIEFDNVDLEEIKGLSNWKLKKDDTVTVNNIGGEFVSSILVDNENSWKEIDKCCRYLINKGAIASSKTGSHIHIGSQILKEDPNNIRKLLKLWELFENIIFYFSYGKDTFPRTGISKYARPISLDLYKIRNSKRGYEKFKSFYDWYHFFQKQNFNKQAGINFRNYKGYEEDEGNTIEIRCPNGTLDSSVWQNNINFFMKFMHKITESDFDEELIDYLLSKKQINEYDLGGVNLLDIEKANMLSEIIFDNEIDKLLFLKQYLKLFEEEKVYTKNKNHSL